MSGVLPYSAQSFVRWISPIRFVCLGARRTTQMADTRPSRRGGSSDVSKVYSYVDVLRTLKRSINKGGTLYSAASPCLHASRTRLID